MTETGKRIARHVIVSVYVLAAACAVSAGARADEARDARAEEYVYSIFAPGKLAPEARERYAARASGGPARGGMDYTLRLAWVAQNWNGLGDATRQLLRQYYNPEASAAGDVRRVLPRSAALKDQKVYITDHFYIYYSTTDPYNGVSSESYVHMVGVALETSYGKEITEMGFPAPTFDEGFDHYMIYLWDIIDCNFNREVYETFGETVPCNGMVSFAVPMGTSYPYGFFLALDHDFYGYYDLMKIIVAHEFFHAVQFGRSAGPSLESDLWYFEGQAVWIEDEVYPYVNDYIGFLQGESGDCNDWFLCTYLTLTRESDDYYRRPYGTSIFFKYLTEYGNHPDAVLKLQAYAETTRDAVQALVAYVNTDMGMTMPDMMLDFGASFLYADGYVDGALYTPEVGFIPHPVYGDFTLRDSDVSIGIFHYGYRTYELSAIQITPTMNIVSSDLYDNARVGIYKCTSRRSGCSVVAEGSNIADFGSAYPWVYVIVANGDPEINATAYSLAVDAGPGPVAHDVDVEHRKWNLKSLPQDPVSGVPADGFPRDGFQFVLAGSYSYASMDEMDVYQPGLSLGSAVWVYPENETGSLSVTTRNVSYNSLDFDIKSRKWNFITTPDLTSETPYDDSHVTFIYASKTFTLSEAVSYNFVGTLYCFDPASGGYVEVPPGGGSLAPWTAYLMKPKVSGTLRISK